MVKFLSNEWIEIAKNIASDNLDPVKDLKRATTSLLNIVYNIPPKGKTIYFYISVNKGKLSEMIVDERDLSSKDAEFTVSGNYDTFVQIFKGEMSTMVALLRNRVEIKGDKLKALEFVKPIDRINDCLRKIDTEF